MRTDSVVIARRPPPLMVVVELSPRYSVDMDRVVPPHDWTQAMVGPWMVTDRIVQSSLAACAARASRIWVSVPLADTASCGDTQRLCAGPALLASVPVCCHKPGFSRCVVVLPLADAWLCPAFGSGAEPHAVVSSRQVAAQRDRDAMSDSVIGIGITPDSARTGWRIYPELGSPVCRPLAYGWPISHDGAWNDPDRCCRG